MATTLQFRRDTTANLASVTGAVGELFVDTTKDTVVVMDGSTAGGFPLAPEGSVTSASTYANTGINNAASASLYANAGVTLAQAAYNQGNSTATIANTKFDTAGGNITGNVTIANNKDLTVTGNLYIQGNTISLNTETLIVTDPLIVLATGNYSTDTKDIGFAGHYNDGTNAHAGFIRDYTTKEFYAFQGYTPEITGSNDIDITDPSFVKANINSQTFKGNVIATTVVSNGVNLGTHTQSAFNRANTAANNTTTVNATFTNYSLTTNALGSGSGSRTIDLTLGNYITATVAGATTWTFSNPIASPNACGFILELTNGGSASQTWPAAVKWPSGTAPTLTAAGVDLLAFITDDAGTTWRGVLSMKDSK